MLLSELAATSLMRGYCTALARSV